MRGSDCKGCPATIIWCVEEVTGKKIPLDPKAPVYVVVKDTFGQAPVVRRAKDDQNNVTAMVSHFATCPSANQFSGSRKEESHGDNTNRSV